MMFSTNDGVTAQAIIEASGNVLVGTSTAFAPSTARTQIAAPATGDPLALKVFTTGLNGQILFWNPNGQVGYIGTNGSSTIYSTSSDYRLKENITPVQGAADIVKAMRPVTYNFKSDSTDWHDGFLAHELQELHPHAVTGSKDAVDEEGNPEYQGVDYSKLTPILTAALQEALNKIDALEVRIAALEA